MGTSIGIHTSYYFGGGGGGGCVGGGSGACHSLSKEKQSAKSPTHINSYR